jgi:hypothetical protein
MEKENIRVILGKGNMKVSVIREKRSILGKGKIGVYNH